MKRVKAAILEGNEIDREILISLELLQSWDLVTSTFPHETISDYIIRKNKENNQTHVFQSSAHNGNLNKITKSETDVSLISFDNSKDYLSTEPQECECGGIVGLEWTILEILVLGLIGIGCLVGIFKGFCHFKSLIQDKMEKAKIARNLRITSQVEAELTEKSANSPLDSNTNQLCRAERRETGPEMVLTFP